MSNNTAPNGKTTTPTAILDRRTAALASVRRSEQAILAVFDARSALDSVLASLALAATGSDPLLAAGEITALASRLADTVAAVRAAAVAAVAHVSKAEIAGFLDTKPSLVFPRPDPRTQPEQPSDVSYQIPPNLNGHEGSNWPAQESDE